MKNDRVILLVEDNPSDIELTKRALAKKNILNDIFVVEDGKSALDFLWGRGEFSGRDITQVPTVILLDLKMPKVGGLEVIQQIRADLRTKRIPIVVLTSSQEEEDLSSAYDLGANSYIRKPVDFVQFADVIALLGYYWLELNEPPPK
ncbi:MAG: response regulator [Bacteroidota bacterium]